MALDVNEAFDDPSLPLGPIGERPFASVSVLHCNLEEAAACLNRKEALMEKAAAVAGVPPSQVNLEAWITPEDLENLADDLLDAGVGIVLITLGASGAPRNNYGTHTRSTGCASAPLGMPQHGAERRASSRPPRGALSCV